MIGFTPTILEPVSWYRNKALAYLTVVTRVRVSNVIKNEIIH